ncbi:hypothetical protein LIER_23283 [Lithospermum erythrorhizon]|uniref:Retrovirus-related Pol polyprotein from transposon TNT 1-94-like beta-barrel domain-containing protein n=1 Tax=Lithospermum erythrorhizon TaxID=34254 RepID=A0AAV3QWV0_LITER
MDEYFQQLHSLYTTLQAVGENVKESDLVAQALLGLNHDFSGFITAMNTQSIRPTFAALRPLLLSEVTRVNVITKSRTQDPAMLLYSSASQKPSHAPSRPYSHINQKFKGKFSKGKSTYNGSYGQNGASAHMTGDISLLHSLVPYNGTTKVMIGNGVLLPISHIGTANISSLTLSDVFLVPDLKKNLISIQKLCLDNSYIVQFSQNTFYVKDPQTMSILLQSNSSGSLYPIQCAAVLALTSQVVPISVYHHTWHQRLGHPALFVFQHLVSNKLIVSTPPNTTQNEQIVSNTVLISDNSTSPSSSSPSQ